MKKKANLQKVKSIYSLANLILAHFKPQEFTTLILAIACLLFDDKNMKMLKPYVNKVYAYLKYAKGMNVFRVILGFQILNTLAAFIVFGGGLVMILNDLLLKGVFYALFGIGMYVFMEKLMNSILNETIFRRRVK